MATFDVPQVPMGDGAVGADAAVQHPWRRAVGLSSAGDAFERFLGLAGFDRAPWLAVGCAGGITAWFVLDTPWQCASALGLSLLVALGALVLWQGRDDRVHLRQAVFAIGLVVALGIAVIWARSAMVGAEPIARPQVTALAGYVLAREEQPARERVRVVLAIRDAELGTARKVRINIPLADAPPDMVEGSVIRLRARLMPPAPPMLPGAYNFARRAWFDGLAATGGSIGPVEIIERGTSGGVIESLQRRLSGHVRDQIDGSAGTIAAALASGDRGAIAEADEIAMRDAGLTHLLSISGLHVSAVVAAAYFLAIKLLALWPALALRVRLPVAAAAVGALAGIAYTLLTGAEVPTVRSCVGAVLVLIALALGREPLSLRMVAVAAFVVLLVWPESLVGPSFQMSFSAVIAIVALHNAAPVRAFLAAREEGWWARFARSGAMLLLTGFVIELALMPVVLFHFHRAGVYGAVANVIAIPLVTFATMPLEALALALDAVGLGEPAWWLAGKSLELLLWIAHTTAAIPGAVKLMPQMTGVNFALFVSGLLWLGLWRGQARLLGLVPVSAGTLMMLTTPVPDVLISSDGRHVGIAGEGDRLITLRDSRSSYSRDNLLELAGLDGEPLPLTQWPGARCSSEFCVLTITRGERDWTLLMARNRAMIEERALAAACEQADIVVADRWLPGACKPRWLKADRNLLEETGGLALFLGTRKMTTVAEAQGEHGWWRGREDRGY